MAAFDMRDPVDNIVEGYSGGITWTKKRHIKNFISENAAATKINSHSSTVT